MRHPPGLIALLMPALCAMTLSLAAQEADIVPVFSIWDVRIGQPAADLPASEVAEVACGTRGGPPSIPLESFADWALCPPEASGLHELSFVYDDEQDYIARALELEYQVLRGGTSVFANPVVVSVLVDDAGLVAGIRIVTDDRVSARDRTNAVTLARNFKARFTDWAVTCTDIPAREGEQPVGNQFIHELCQGQAPDGSGQTIVIEATYLRKRGQEGLSRESQTVNTGYFESRTFFELVAAPHVAGRP